VHHFVVSAFVETALACCDGPDAVWPECRRLRNLLKFEFFFSRSPVFRQQVEQELEGIDPDWKRILSAGNDSAVTLLREKPLLVAPGILKPFTHAYRLVAETIHRHDRGCDLPDEALIGLCLEANRDEADRGVGGPPPPASRALLGNALRLADSLGLRSGDTPAIRARRSSFLEELERTDQALSRLDELALSASKAR
jgi:glycerol-3-phosphate O-acyltransferase